MSKNNEDESRGVFFWKRWCTCCAVASFFCDLDLLLLMLCSSCLEGARSVHGVRILGRVILISKLNGVTSDNVVVDDAQLLSSHAAGRHIEVEHFLRVSTTDNGR